MALSDPFQTTYEGSLRAKSTLGEGLLKVAEMFAQQKQKENLLEKEYQLKQKYPDPFTAFLAKQMGLGENNQSGIQSPAFNEEEAIKRIPKEENPQDWIAKPEIKNIKGVPTQVYLPEKRPEAVERDKKLAETEATRETAKGLIRQLKQDYLVAFSDAPKGGVGIYPYGIGKFAESLSQTNPKLTSYNQTRKAFLSLLTRGLGEKGVLTNQDINRIAEAVPSGFTSQDTAMQNFKTIESILEEGTKKGMQKIKTIASQPKIDENTISQYMKKYPNRSREEIIAAMQKGK